jgi:hypothetical protein
MVLRKIMGLLACSLVVGMASFAMAGVPDLALSTATTAATEPVSLFNLPSGAGSELEFDAQAFGGSVMDATITLWLVDGLGDPIISYGFEDMWLETTLGGLSACTAGTTADQNTDDVGMTRWINALQAGGSTDPATELTVVVINGDALSQAGFNIQHNSADFDGNGAANISDIAAFTQILFGAYLYAADFLWDGVINLLDVALMAQGNGTSCP